MELDNCTVTQDIYFVEPSAILDSQSSSSKSLDVVSHFRTIIRSGLITKKFIFYYYLYRFIYYNNIYIYKLLN